MVTNEEMLCKMQAELFKQLSEGQERLTSWVPVSIFAKTTVISFAIIFALTAQLLEAPMTFTLVSFLHTLSF